MVWVTSILMTAAAAAAAVTSSSTKKSDHLNFSHPLLGGYCLSTTTTTTRITVPTAAIATTTITTRTTTASAATAALIITERQGESCRSSSRWRCPMQTHAPHWPPSYPHLHKGQALVPWHKGRELGRWRWRWRWWCREECVPSTSKRSMCSRRGGI